MILKRSEIIWFLKKKIVQILLGTIIFTSVFVAMMYKIFPETNKTSNLAVSNNIENLPRAVFFQFYIEDIKNESFKNNLLLEEYLLSNEVLQEMELQTEVKISDRIKKVGNLITFGDEAPVTSKVLGINRDEDSNLMIFTVNTGLESENIKIANYFFEVFSHSHNKILDNKNVYMITEPEFITNKITKQQKIMEESVDYSFLINNLTIGISLSLPATILLLLLSSRCTKKMGISLSYQVDVNDSFIIINKNTLYDDKKIIKLLLKQHPNPLFIFEDRNESQSTINDIFSNDSLDRCSLNSIKNIYEIEKISKVERLIYIIEQNKTSRDWYEKQREIDKLYNLPTTIIHLTEDI